MDPAGAELTPRADTMAAWESIPESERPFQRRLMEVFAGFVEHTDAQVGKLVDGLEQLGVRENTIVFYIWGDNGSQRRGSEGKRQRIARPEQRREHDRAADRGHERDRRIAGPRWAEGGQHVPCRLGLGRQHSLPVHQARRRALRGHPQPDGHLLAEGDQAGQDAAIAIPSRQRHHANSLRSDRHQAPRGSERVQAGPDGRREHGIYVRGRPGTGPQEDAILREQREPWHLP